MHTQTPIRALTHMYTNTLTSTLTNTLTYMQAGNCTHTVHTQVNTSKQAPACTRALTHVCTHRPMAAAPHSAASGGMLISHFLFLVP